MFFGKKQRRFSKDCISLPSPFAQIKKKLVHTKSGPHQISSILTSMRKQFGSVKNLAVLVGSLGLVQNKYRDFRH